MTMLYFFVTSVLYGYIRFKFRGELNKVLIYMLHAMILFAFINIFVPYFPIFFLLSISLALCVIVITHTLSHISTSTSYK